MNPYPELYLPDDFSQTGEMMKNNISPPAGSVDVTSFFEKLVRGKTIGKRANIVIQGALPTATVQQARTDIMTLQGRDEDAMPLCITLSPPKAVPGVFGLNDANISSVTGEQENSDVAAAYIFPRIVARLEWGIGGVSQSAEIDYINGAKINIQASFVRLSAFLEAAGGESGAVIVLGAFAGPAQGQGLTATRTVPTDAVIAGVGQLGTVFPVPRFAKRYRFVQQGAQASVFDIVFFKDRAAAVEVGRQRWNSNALASEFQPCAIPNGGYYFRFRNQSAGVVIDTAQVVFDLDI